MFVLFFNFIRQTYMHRGGPLVGLAICDQGQSLASSASQSGTVFVLRIESNSNKMNVIGTRQLDLQVINYINCINYIKIYFLILIN